MARGPDQTYLPAWKLPENAGTSSRQIRVTVDGAAGAQVRARQGYWPE